MKPLLIASVAASLLVPSAAFADVADRRHEEGADYYSFDDDPLHSDVGNAGAPRIEVLPKGPRVMLLRARVSFVPEMLKSVQKI